LGYDLAWEIERLPYLKQDSLPFPVAYWYEPENFAVLDHWEQILWLAASDPSQLDVLHNQVEQSPPAPPASPAPPAAPNPHKVGTPSSPAPPPLFLTSQEDYEAAVRRAKKYIQAGDIFQANLSLRFESYTAASGWTIYQALQQINPSPFASYWQTPWGSVISCSPERLVQLQSQHAETRPIAGTRRRGATPQQDRQLAQDLLTNAKERAEHIMLVDLQRNDLGRVCKWGSVAVNELLTIEQYSHVIHLVSSITGTISPDYNAIDLIRAMFPGGTITGCPKVRCMEIIEELEPVRRNLFYGSCGYLDWRGNLDLNILIRTLLYSRGDKEDKGTRGTRGPHLVGIRGEGDKGTKGQGDKGNSGPPPCGDKGRRGQGDKGNSGPPPCGDKGRRGQGDKGTRRQGGKRDNYELRITNYELLNVVWGQVGAGIVADSDPEREWHESLYKAQAQLAALKKALS
jgi:para-aminobenzoate synthetase component 1